MRFHAGRWESVYVPEALAVGEGPTTWAAYFNQQYRWAFGCMNIFFTPFAAAQRQDAAAVTGCTTSCSSSSISAG